MTTSRPTTPAMTDNQPDGDLAAVEPPPHLVSYLKANRAVAEFVAPGVPMPTVPAAAAALGVADELILKSLLFRDDGGHPVLAIACGTGRIDRARLATATGLGRLRLADPATVQAVTGFPAGGVAPVGHATAVPVVIDRRAADLAVAYGGGGREELLLRIAPAEILRLTGGVIADIVAD